MRLDPAPRIEHAAKSILAEVYRAVHGASMVLSTVPCCTVHDAAKAICRKHYAARHARLIAIALHNAHRDALRTLRGTSASAPTGNRWSSAVVKVRSRAYGTTARALVAWSGKRCTVHCTMDIHHLVHTVRLVRLAWWVRKVRPCVALGAAAACAPCAAESPSSDRSSRGCGRFGCRRFD